MMSTSPTPERLPRIPPDKMPEAQKKAAAELAAGPRGELRGPFIALLRSPGLMSAVQKVGEYLRFNCPLDRRVTELATLIAARFWTQQYEWQGDREAAMKAGRRSPNGGRHRGGTAANGDEAGRGDRLRVADRDAPQQERERCNLRAGRGEVRRGRRRGPRRSRRLLPDAGADHEHGANGAAGGQVPAAGSFSL